MGGRRRDTNRHQLKHTIWYSGEGDNLINSLIWETFLSFAWLEACVLNLSIVHYVLLPVDKLLQTYYTILVESYWKFQIICVAFVEVEH